MTFDFSDFSKYRTQLMGISILLIMMFHVGFFKCGYIGVEFFLLISAIGLFFSLSKDQRLIPFYKKRLIRILPAYFIVAIPTFIYLQGGNFDFGQLLYDLAGLYILDSHRYLWFVHLIIICYLIAPFYFKLMNYKYSKFVPFIALIVFYYLAMQYKPIGILLNRFAIFFLGFHLAKWVYEKKQIRIKYLALYCFLVWILIIASKEVHFYGELRLIMFFFLSIPAVMGLILVLKVTPPIIHKWLVFLGGITLEIYLVHERIYLEILDTLFTYKVASIISFPLAIIAAYILHKFVNFIIQYLQAKQLVKGI